MSQQLVDVEVLVIGAGIAGLLAARALEAAGVRALVVDKSSNVGGRLATRRIGPGQADHGAQFFTTREPAFEALVNQWRKEGLVYEWSRGWSDGSLKPQIQDGHVRYAVHGGMNALAKHIAADLHDVRLNTPIVTATRDEQGWIFQDEDGSLFSSRALVMTPPVPQALAIVDAGATTLHADERKALDNIHYAPTLTGLFWIEGRVTLPLPGAVQRRNAPVSWIADNQTKGISPNATLITVQASEQFSTQMWSAPDDRILNSLRTDLQIFMDESAQVIEAQLKRWQYALPTTLYPDRFLLTRDTPRAVFAGDAFGGPRVEGAALSGLAAAEALLAAL